MVARGCNKKPRPLPFVLHSFLGLNLSLLLLFVNLTGTVAVFGDELDWIASPKFRAGSGIDRVGWEEQFRAAQAAYPDHEISYLMAGEESYLASRILSAGPDGDFVVIFVDPSSGRVTGHSGFYTIGPFLRALHSYLFVPGDFGFYVVTGLSFVLAVSLVTGLLVYKKFWRGFFRLPRCRAGVRVFWGDVHRLTALWSLWFVAIITATGFWYFAERIMYRLKIDLETPRVAMTASETRPRLSLDELAAIAMQALPGLAVSRIELPTGSSPVISMAGHAEGWMVRDRANLVEMNAATGEVLAVRRAETMPVLERWVHTADPLHFGDFGGLWSKAIWAVFGALMCGLSVSGVLIYAKRTATSVLRSLVPVPRGHEPSSVGRP